MIGGKERVFACFARLILFQKFSRVGANSVLSTWWWLIIVVIVKVVMRQGVHFA